jgi:hypothetical protein
MDGLDVKGTDALWRFGHRICGWFVVESAETKERATGASQKNKIEYQIKRTASLVNSNEGGTISWYSKIR